MTTLEAEANRATWAPMVLSIALIIFGFLAIALPMATSIGVVMIIGWLVTFSAIALFVHGFHSVGIGHIVWKLLVAALYLAMGAYLLARPALGVATLTLLLAAFLIVEGASDIIAYLSTRRSGTSLWMLIDGIVVMFLGFMIWNRWPFDSSWVTGTLFGVGMIMTGFSRLMMSLAVRKLASHLGDSHWRERPA